MKSSKSERVSRFVMRRLYRACTDSADDRARRFRPRTPCTESGDDRARRFETRRTFALRAYMTVLAAEPPPQSLH